MPRGDISTPGGRTVTMTSDAKDQQDVEAASDRSLKKYHLISADSHINEPADLWTSTGRRRSGVTGCRGSNDSSRAMPGSSRACPGRCRSGSTRAPGKIRGCGRTGCASTRSAAAAGIPRCGSRRSRSRASTPRCCIRRRVSRSPLRANTDPEMHLALVQAYNDWLHEYAVLRPAALPGAADHPEPRRRSRPRRDRAGGRATVDRWLPHRAPTRAARCSRSPRTTPCSPRSKSRATRSTSTCRCRPRCRRCSTRSRCRRPVASPARPGT